MKIKKVFMFDSSFLGMSPSLVDKLNFELAAEQVIIDSSTDSIIDKLGVEILKEFKTEIIDYLKEKIITSDSKKN